MAVSINNILKTKADQYFISHGSTERQKIVASLTYLKANLQRNFGQHILSLDEFGSYKRGTILPRAYDSLSDIDLLIEFDHGSINVHPSTYRNYLRNFAQAYYPRSTIYKSSPTVVLELDHIKYDLVPCYTTINWLNSTKQYYIPETDTSWMYSDIYGFNTKLTAVNTSYNSIVKPIIRLFKAWNAKVGFPYDSFQLEQEISKVNFNGDNYQSGFFYAARGLNTFTGTTTLTTKVDALKKNIDNVEYYLKNDNLTNALIWLSHILPS